MGNRVGDSLESQQVITSDIKNNLKSKIICMIVSSVEDPDYFGRFEKTMLDREVDFLLEVFLPIER